MKRIYLLLILSALIFSGCKFFKSDFVEFKEQALEFAKNDNRINQKEYENLIEQISLSEEKGFHQFKDDNGKVDNVKVVSYLLTYFESKKLALTQADLWQFEKTKVKIEKFNINVFLENSASMDGYVKGVTEFETAIYNLLGDFKISGVCDSLNLNYINKSIPYSKQNALAPDIQDFIEKLEPSIFRQRGGDRSVSDLKNVLNTVLETVNNKNAAILISDFVFSPGGKTNAQDFLNNQGVGIKIDFAEKLKSYDLSAVVIQLESNFDGLYYDKTNTKIYLNCKRPYYIWVIGNSKQITEILDKKFLDNINGGYKNRLVLQKIKGTNNPSYKIQSKPVFGSFDRSEIGKGVLAEAKGSEDIQNKGLFGFNVAVDFSNSLQDANYFMDITNYKLSNENYNLKFEKIKNNQDASLTGFTHILKLQTAFVRDEILRIDVIGNTPAWVFNSTSIDDSNISRDALEEQKTFGLKFLIEGVSDAFYPKSNSNSISSIKINIKK